MWTIQMHWFDKWMTIQDGFASVEDAEWRIEQWDNKVFCNMLPFRVVHQDDLANGKVAGAPLKPIDSKVSK